MTNLATQSLATQSFATQNSTIQSSFVQCSTIERSTIQSSATKSFATQSSTTYSSTIQSLAIESSTSSTKKNDKDVAKASENENMYLLAKKFVKYLKRRGNKGKQKRYNSKHNDSNSTPNFTYYNYGKQGHIKIECPNINQTKDT